MTNTNRRIVAASEWEARARELWVPVSDTGSSARVLVRGAGKAPGVSGILIDSAEPLDAVTVAGITEALVQLIEPPAPHFDSGLRPDVSEFIKHLKRKLETGESGALAAVAQEVGISRPTAYRWLQEARDAGVEGLPRPRSSRDR